MDFIAFPGFLAHTKASNVTVPVCPGSEAKLSEDASRTLAIIESFGYR
jgi:hypothetical protein